MGTLPIISWLADHPCALRVETPLDATTLLAGRTLSFIGDSTTREMVYDLARWIAECEDIGSGIGISDAESRTCADVTSLRRRRNVPSAHFKIQRGSGLPLRLAYYRIEQMRTLQSKDWFERIFRTGNFGDALVLNAGLWNLKHDFATLGRDPERVRSNYLSEVEDIITAFRSAPAAERLRERLLWRGLLPIEHAANLTVGAFTRDSVQRVEVATERMWTTAGIAVFDAWTLGLHAEYDDVLVGSDSAQSTLLLTRDGVHFPATVNVRLGCEVLSAVVHRLSDAAVSSGGDEEPALTPGGDAEDPTNGTQPQQRSGGIIVPYTVAMVMLWGGAAALLRALRRRGDAPRIPSAAAAAAAPDQVDHSAVVAAASSRPDAVGLRLREGDSWGRSPSTSPTQSPPGSPTPATTTLRRAAPANVRFLQHVGAMRLGAIVRTYVNVEHA